MKPRERVLLIGIGGILGAVVLFFIGNSVYGRWTSNNRLIASEKANLEALNKEIARGKEAEAKLQKWTEKSLPSNLILAQSVYQDKLTEWVLTHRIAEGKVTPLAAHNAAGVYQQFSFQVTGRASLKQTVQLLFDFYSRDVLHRISRFRFKPNPETGELDILLTIDALAMTRAPKKRDLPPAIATKLAHGDSAAYVKAIQDRNIFGPAHKPPTVSSTARPEYYYGSDVSFSVRGSDPEKKAITYTVDKASFEGYKFDEKGVFSWKPPAKGNYDLTVTATDAGTPPKSATTTIKFAVVDPPEVTTITPPPLPPPFDVAKHMHLIAVFDVEGKREAWLDVRTTGQKLKLQAGEKIDVSTFKGTLVSIGDQEIDIETDKGEVITVSLGSTVREGTKKTPPPPTTAAVGEKPMGEKPALTPMPMPKPMEVAPEEPLEGAAEEFDPDQL